jgi:hypothetical protein
MTFVSVVVVYQQSLAFFVCTWLLSCLPIFMSHHLALCFNAKNIEIVGITVTFYLVQDMGIPAGYRGWTCTQTCHRYGFEATGMGSKQVFWDYHK